MEETSTIKQPITGYLHGDIMGMLYHEQPLVVNPQLARLIGLNEAIVLQQIKYWTEKNSREGRNQRDGRFWTYNSYTEWQEQFPFWSLNTLKRTFKSLEKQTLIVSGVYNKDSRDRTKWYALNYASTQNESMERPKMSRPLPETNTETNNTSSSEESAAKAFPLQEEATERKGSAKRKEAELLDLLREKTGRNFRTLPLGYKKTLDMFTLDEIAQALDYMKADKWHSNIWHELKPAYLLRCSTIDDMLTRSKSSDSGSYKTDDTGLRWT